MEMKPEERFQRAVVRRLPAALEASVEWWAVNKGVFYGGGSSEEDKRRRFMMSASQTAMGVKNGVHDVFFSWPGKNMLTVDLKWGKNAPDEDQLRFQRKMIACGFASDFAWSATQLEAIMRAAGVPMVGSFGAIVDQFLAVETPSPKKPSEPRKERKGVSAKAKAFQLLQYGVKS